MGVILVGDDHDGCVTNASREAGLALVETTADALLARRTITTPRALVLRTPAPRIERELLQLRLQSHPALFGSPLVVISSEDDIDSFSGAITKGAAAFLVESPSV